MIHCMYIGSISYDTKSLYILFTSLFTFIPSLFDLFFAHRFDNEIESRAA